MTAKPIVIVWAGTDDRLPDRLRNEAWEVRTVEDPAAIGPLVSGDRPAAAVVRLDGPPAEKAIEAIRSGPGGVELPILAVGTESSRIRSPVDAVSVLGVDSFISHKEGPDRLLRVLDRIVKRSIEPLPKAEPLAPGAIVGPAPFDAKPDAGPKPEPAPDYRVSEELQQVIRRIEGRLFAGKPAAVERAPWDVSAPAPEPARSADSMALAPTVLDGRPDRDAPAADTAPLAASRGKSSEDTWDDIEADRETPVPEARNQGDITAEYPKGSIPPEPPVDEGRVLAYAGFSGRLAPGVPSSGRVDEIAVPVLLALAMAAKLSGRLELVRERVKRSIHLADGQPILAASEAPEDRLVEMLKDEGRLNERQYETYGRQLTESGRRMGVLLVEHGVIKPRDLFPLVRRHYEEIVFRCFAWTDGEWAFEPGVAPVGERIRLDLPAAALLMEGVRRKLGGAWALEALGGDGARPAREAEGLCSIDEAGLLPEEHHVVDLCDGERSLASIAVMADRPADDVAAIVLGLFYLGHVSLERPLAAPRAAASSEAARPAPAPRRTETRDLLLERARVEEKLSMVRDGSYFAVLGVAPYASQHEIRQAYRQLRRELSLERFLTPEMKDLVPTVEEVLFVVEEAYEILRDADLRETYRRACGE